MLISDIISNYRLNDDITFQKVYKSNPEHDKLEIIIVNLTGGPCGGKTTVVEKIKELSLLMGGYKIFIANEAAENLISGLITFMDAGADDTFQREVVTTQLNAEKNTVITAIKYKIAHPYEFVFCIFDRSLMDGQAYFDNPSDFLNILLDYGYTRQDVYNRIDRVVYMQSAANGAEEYFKTTAIRKESLKEARARDNKVRDAWKYHKDFCPVLNKKGIDFNEKERIAITKIFELGTKNILGRYKVSYIVDKNSGIKNDKNVMSFINSKTIFLSNNSDCIAEEIRYLSNENGEVCQHITYTGVDKGANSLLSNGEPCNITISEVGVGGIVEYASRIITTIPAFEKNTYIFYIDSHFCEYTEFEGVDYYDKGILTIYSNQPEEDISKVKKMVGDMFVIHYRIVNEVNYLDYNIAMSRG